MSSWLLSAIALLLLARVPFAPQLVRLRIRILRALQWMWAVDLLENHFQLWVQFFRTVLLLIALGLLALVGLQ